MSVSEALGIRKGDKVAVIGCGGKTTLINQLARENAELGVLIAPTTRIGLDQRMDGIDYLGIEAGEKLLSAPLTEIEVRSRQYGLVLMEADGSRGLPLKGWAEHEPVVPEFATLTIGVVSAKAIGLEAAAENVHRLNLFLEQMKVEKGTLVDEALLYKMIVRQMEKSAVGRQQIVMANGQEEISWKIW